uniref:NADH-ubiquinone oxidoreductase chain 2 n=1 Tax=Histeroidea sp. 5 KM-2017 TaxID=2219438 RepID=A0A346RGU3_9COLE|nr:NADH dehydrogenase subunit 2 [Histeroidea sp. 5 KM-2017]
MMNLYKMMFTLSLFIGTLITISANSWMGIWLGLEINLLSFIPLINNNNNALSNESAIKYFITQALASTIIVFSMILMMGKSINNEMSNLMISTSMMIKMGAAPFHFWFPEVMEGLNWSNSMILLTWQKIAPFTIISYIKQNMNFIIITIIASMLISGIMGINQVSLRKIMAFSSINHIGWMISIMIYSNLMWTMYFLVYTIISVNIIIMFWMYNLSFFNQIHSNEMSPMLKIIFMINLMSLGGVPPFLGFIPKWITIQLLISQFNMFLIIFMIMLTLIPLFFYTRLMFSSLLIITSKISFKFNMIYNMNWILITMNTMNIFSFILIPMLTMNL